ncbi:MAG: DUF6285 domain-containing protein [Leptospiraceae bacterium]|nr:DUF6285 domain-containing protein [Leptospiraceae bacterium]
MQDRPSANELLEAIADFLIKDVMPAVKNDDLLSYKTLVSWNMLGVIGREIKLGEINLKKELTRLSTTLGTSVSLESKTYLEIQEMTRELNQVLSKKIQSEKISIEDKKIWEAVKETLREKLEISNPKFLSGKE